MSPALQVWRRLADELGARRSGLAEAWSAALRDTPRAAAEGLEVYCARRLEAVLHTLADSGPAGLLEEEAARARASARDGRGLLDQVLELRAWDGVCEHALLAREQAPLPEAVAALQELGRQRLEAVLRAHEQECARRLEEAQDGAARALERARDLAGIHEELQRERAQSQHRADQIALISAFARRIAMIRDPDRLLQEAAEVIQARMSHNYVAVVVLDAEGVLVGRWAGRQGVGRRSAGRAQGPAGGVIGRALRKRAPQVVDDVVQDADYHPDVPGTRSEMVIPLLEEGEAVGAVDFQSDRAAAFDLDAVATGETVAEFLGVALRNARLLAEARKP